MHVLSHLATPQLYMWLTFCFCWPWCSNCHFQSLKEKEPLVPHLTATDPTDARAHSSYGRPGLAFPQHRARCWLTWTTADKGTVLAEFSMRICQRSSSILKERNDQIILKFILKTTLNIRTCTHTIYTHWEGRLLGCYLSYFWVFSHHVSEANVHQICTTADTQYPPFQIIFRFSNSFKSSQDFGIL